MAHPTLEKARYVNGAHWLAQTDRSFPFGDMPAIAAWLASHGYTATQSRPEYCFATCGLEVTQHGVVRALRSSNL